MRSVKNSSSTIVPNLNGFLMTNFFRKYRHFSLIAKIFVTKFFVITQSPTKFDRNFLSIPIYSYLFLSILIYSYLFLSIPIHSYPFLTLAGYGLVSSVPVATIAHSPPTQMVPLLSIVDSTTDGRPMVSPCRKRLLSPLAMMPCWCR